MFLKPTTIDKIKAFIRVLSGEKSDKKPDTGPSLFSSSKPLQESLPDQYKQVIALIIKDGHKSLLTVKDIQVLNDSVANLLHTSTMIKILNEVLKRNASLSMWHAFSEGRELANTAVKTAVSIATFWAIAFFSPVSWSSMLALDITATTVGGLGYIEHEHPGIINAWVDCLTLSLAPAEFSYFENIISHGEILKIDGAENSKKLA